MVSATKYNTVARRISLGMGFIRNESIPLNLMQIMEDLLINVNQFIYIKGNQIRFDLQNGVKFTVSITIFLIVNFLFFSILSVRGM